MPADPDWTRCDPALGAAIWRALREQLGKTACVGATYSSQSTMITEVWSRTPDLPLLRCESRYATDDSGNRVLGDVGEHHYYLPARQEDSDD